LKLLTALLTLKGHQVVGLPNGDRLTEVLRTHQPPPNLVLLDIQLPGRDGYAVLEELKALPERSCKVVALSAHALPEDRARPGAHALDRHLRGDVAGRRPEHPARRAGARGSAAPGHLSRHSGVHNSQVLGTHRSDDGRQSGGAILEEYHADRCVSDDYRLRND